ncbi:MAG: nucleoid-associated protein [Bacteroidales bacterium]
MIDHINTTLNKLCAHWVGNKTDELLIQSKQEIDIEDELLRDTLISYFFNSFKTEDYYNFYHESDLKYNEVYGYASDIFENPSIIFEQSINLAKHLYEKSIHPKVKGGEFYVVYFQECILNGMSLDAIGLFKSENKDTFLKVRSTSENFGIEAEKGININKLDKGCLIFNAEKENGYIVAIVDNTNKGSEAQYWVDDFLHIKQRQDEYFNTNNLLSMCKTFVTKDLPTRFDVSKADQADLLNKSVQFFKEKDNFDIREFANQVMEQPEVIESFNSFKQEYEEGLGLEIMDNFNISESAVKKQARSFKSVIKLDKNFHIYVHGDRKLIEQGQDERGKYYKVYYREEE